MTRVPVQHGLGFGERRQMLRCDKSLDRDRAQIDHEEIVALLERLRAGLADTGAEAPGAVHEAEENRFGARRKRLCLIQRECRIVQAVAFFQHDHLAADHVGLRARLFKARTEPSGVETPLGGAIDRALGVAEVGLRAEIRARRHHAGH